MGYKRRSSLALEAALTRRANLAKIDPVLDLGHGNTLAVYDAEIVAVQTKLSAYNQILAAADDALNQLQGVEKVLKRRSTKMLAGVGVAFGKESSQYEMAGGHEDRGQVATLLLFAGNTTEQGVHLRAYLLQLRLDLSNPLALLPSLLLF